MVQQSMEQPERDSIGSLKWWTAREAAREWRVSEDTVTRECNAHRIPHMKIGRQIRIHQSVIYDREIRAIAGQQNEAKKATRRRHVLPQVPDRFGEALAARAHAQQQRAAVG